MYFPLLKPHSWGKRSAVQPKTIYSEVPILSSVSPNAQRYDANKETMILSANAEMLNFFCFLAASERMYFLFDTFFRLKYLF